MPVCEVQNRIVIMLVALARMCFCMKSMGKSMGKCLTHRDTYNIINQYDDERNRMLQSPGGF